MQKRSEVPLGRGVVGQQAIRDDQVDATFPGQRFGQFELGQRPEQLDRLDQRVGPIGAFGAEALRLVAKRPGELILDVLLQRGQLMCGQPVGFAPAGEILWLQPEFQLVGQLAERPDCRPQLGAGFVEERSAVG